MLLDTAFLPRQILWVHTHLSKSKKRYMVREMLGNPVISQLFLLWGVSKAHVWPSYDYVCD